MSVHRYVLYLIVAACLYAASCSVLKRAGWTAGGAGAGAGVGAMVGGPAGAAVGGAAGAVAASTLGENSELRDGDLIGEGAAEKYRIIYKDRAIIPTWIWWALGGYLLWTKGHHLWALMNGGGLGKLLNIVLPSWMQQKLGLSAPKA